MPPSGAIGSSGITKLLQLIPVDKLPPLWNFLLECKVPGWRASPTRQARRPYRARSRRLVPGCTLRRLHPILSSYLTRCVPYVETGTANSMCRRGSLPCVDQARGQAKQQGTRKATGRTPSVVAANWSFRGSRAHLPIGARWTRIEQSIVRHPW